MYNPGQFNEIIPYVDFTPEWLLLGGPADGNEAQCAAKKWPGIQILGIEPCEEMRAWQQSHKWPKNAHLLPYALSNVVGTAEIRLNKKNPRCSSLMMDREGEVDRVQTVTLDLLNSSCGPFRKAILWLDIEGYELEALQGAKGLFESGAVELVNVEIIERREENTIALEWLLEKMGFILLNTWNTNRGPHHDRVYRKARV